MGKVKEALLETGESGWDFYQRGSDAAYLIFAGAGEPYFMWYPESTLVNVWTETEENAYSNTDCFSVSEQTAQEGILEILEHCKNYLSLEHCRGYLRGD